MWAVLKADIAPLMMSYTITLEDTRGPFVTVPIDIKAQAKLPALGYTSSLEAISERFSREP